MIISRTKKLEALNNFTKLVGDDPVLAYLMGFLAGQVDRVHFVRDLRGADISLRLSQASLTVWPGAPFTASVGGVVVPHPVAFVKAVGQTNPDRQIFVSLSFDRADEFLSVLTGLMKLNGIRKYCFLMFPMCNSARKQRKKG